MMNLHHVELFFHVVNHQGLSRAVGHLPYGIGLSALSEQIRQLEAWMGARLFDRHPFRLTAKGRRLYDQIRPFFESFDAFSRNLKAGGPLHLRIGGPDAIIDACFPRLIPELRALAPDLRLTCVRGMHDQIEQALDERRIDVAITFLGRRKPPRTRCQRLVTLPLALFVPRTSPIRSEEQLWTQRIIEERLICPDPTGPIAATFQSALHQGRIRWEPAVVTNSLTAVADCVAAGEGIGLGVDAPWAVATPALPAIRILRLTGVSQVALAAMWASPGSATVRSVVSLLTREARRWNGWAELKAESIKV